MIIGDQNGIHRRSEPRMPADVKPAWAHGYTDRLHGVDRQENPYRDRDDDGWLFAS
jgi:hypothetical protein